MKTMRITSEDFLCA